MPDDNLNGRIQDSQAVVNEMNKGSAQDRAQQVVNGLEAERESQRQAENAAADRAAEQEKKDRAREDD